MVVMDGDHVKRGEIVVQGELSGGEYVRGIVQGNVRIPIDYNSQWSKCDSRWNRNFIYYKILRY